MDKNLLVGLVMAVVFPALLFVAYRFVTGFNSSVKTLHDTPAAKEISARIIEHVGGAIQHDANVLQAKRDREIANIKSPPSDEAPRF